MGIVGKKTWERVEIGLGDLFNALGVLSPTRRYGQGCF